MRSVFGAPDELFEEAKHPQETFQLLLPEPKAFWSFNISTSSKLRVYNFVNLVPRYQKIHTQDKFLYNSFSSKSIKNRSAN